MSDARFYISIGTGAFEAKVKAEQHIDDAAKTIAQALLLEDIVSRNNLKSVFGLINATKLVSEKTVILSQALMLASAHPDHISFLTQLVIEMKPNLNERHHLETTPLGNAVYHGNLEAVRLLLRSGARVDALNDSGMTPLNELLFEVFLDDECNLPAPEVVTGRVAAVYELLIHGGIDQVFIDPPSEPGDSSLHALPTLIKFLEAQDSKERVYVNNILIYLNKHLSGDSRTPPACLDDIQYILGKPKLFVKTAFDPDELVKSFAVLALGSTSKEKLPAAVKGEQNLKKTKQLTWLGIRKTLGEWEENPKEPKQPRRGRDSFRP